MWVRQSIFKESWKCRRRQHSDGCAHVLRLLLLCMKKAKPGLRDNDLRLWSMKERQHPTPVGGPTPKMRTVGLQQNTGEWTQIYMFFFLLIWEREREKHQFVVPLAFIGWFLNVAGEGIEPTTVVNWGNSLTSWAAQPGLYILKVNKIFKVSFKNNFHFNQLLQLALLTTALVALN